MLTKIKHFFISNYRFFLSFSKTHFHYYIICALSVLAFILIYGPYVINPTYSDWLMSGGDLSQHYIGWRAYLNADFMFPFGLTDQLSYPNLSCVIFTDSIPLFAMFFKLFKSVLPQNFQYFGLWGVLCFILIGIFSLKIISRFIDKKLTALLATSFFLIVPIVLSRMFVHTALAAQWLILMTIDFFLDIYKNDITVKKTIVISIVIGALCALIHFYFVALCGFIFLSICIYKILSDKNGFSLLNCFLPFAAMSISIFALIGGFVGRPIPTSVGYGTFSSNLNAFINPLGYSSILPDLATSNPGQWEGSAYLGLGIMILLLSGIILFITTNDTKAFIKKHKKILIALLILFIASATYAISNVVAFNSRVLFTIPLPSFVVSVFSIFRSSGRFMWINVYLLMFTSIFLISKVHLKYNKIPEIMLGFCLIMQTIDLTKGFININNRFNKNNAYQSSLKETKFWQQIANDKLIKNIILTFRFDFLQKNNQKLAYSIANFAVENKKTLNTFYFSQEVYDFEGSIDNLITNNKDSYVYISCDGLIFCAMDNDWPIYNIDNLLVSTKREIKDYVPIQKKDISYNYVFNGNYIINGKDDDNIRTLYQNGVSYGPYLLLGKGGYHINIEGYNLSNVSSGFTIDNGRTAIEQKNKISTDQLISYDIDINKLSHNSEVVLTNQGESSATIKSIKINYLNN